MPTPHGGGIAIAFTWFAGYIYLLHLTSADPSLFYALIVGSLLSLVSYIDDLYRVLWPKMRLVTRSFVSVAFMLSVVQIKLILDFGYLKIN